MLALLRRHARLVGLLVTGCVGLYTVGVVRRSPDGPDPYASAIIKAHSRKMAADAQALREARAAVVHDSIHVAQNVYRYRTIRDTLNIHDTVQVIRFVARADSVVRACTELQSSCALFRVRADSVIADLTTERDALAAEVKALHPSRVGTLWARVRVPLAFVAGVYVGTKVTR